jgi:uncharacterized protein YaiI (UPF0178 family)
MTIWVDADAVPTLIKEILIRASRRTRIPLVFIANQPIPVPADVQITAFQVSSGFDKADDEIVERVKAGDMVITQDIPLAAEVIAKGGLVVTPRGDTLDKQNIGARLNMRDFMDSMRGSGMQTGGPPPMTETDRRHFAGLLDRYLAKQPKQPIQPIQPIDPEQPKGNT